MASLGLNELMLVLSIIKFAIQVQRLFQLNGSGLQILVGEFYSIDQSQHISHLGTVLLHKNKLTLRENLLRSLIEKKLYIYWVKCMWYWRFHSESCEKYISNF